MPLNQSPILVIGTGDLGCRVSNLLKDSYHQVMTVSRRAENTAHTGQHFSANVVTGEGLQRLPYQVPSMVYCLAPDQRTEASYRDVYFNGLKRVLDVCQPQRLIFIGSTAVYAQDAGEWVDENSPALAVSFNGAVLKDCESLCQSYDGAVALRLSGIYGPGRNYMIRRAQAGELGRAHWTNRIHIDDAAQAIAHVANLQNPNAIYCVSDDQPALETEVLAWLQDQQAAPPNDSPRACTGRRVSNQALRNSGWQPQFVNYRAGYLPQLSGEGALGV
jgi:nucleoside-diphosphate-sugar epimerase